MKANLNLAPALVDLNWLSYREGVRKLETKTLV